MTSGNDLMHLHISIYIFRKRFLEKGFVNPAVMTINFSDGVMFISTDSVMGIAVVTTAKE